MGASSDTSSHRQSQQMLDELRELRRSVERLEQTITTLPAKRDAERRARRSEHYDMLIQVLGGTTLWLLIGIPLVLVVLRFADWLQAG